MHNRMFELRNQTWITSLEIPSSGRFSTTRLHISSYESFKIDCPLTEKLSIMCPENVEILPTGKRNNQVIALISYIFILIYLYSWVGILKSMQPRCQCHIFSFVVGIQLGYNQCQMRFVLVSETVSSTTSTGTTIYTVAASDPENDAVSFSMTCDKSPCPFSIKNSKSRG